MTAPGLAEAALATLLALAIGVPAALHLREAGRRTRAAAVAMLAAPWLVPPATLALALRPLADHGGEAAPAILGGALLALAPIVLMPVIVVPIVPVTRSLAARHAPRAAEAAILRAAAANGIAPGLAVRRLVLPRLARGVAAGAALGFLAAAGIAPGFAGRG